MPEYKELRLLLGDQQNIHHSWFLKKDPQVLYVMLEMHQESEYVIHHIQKLMAFFLSMRLFKLELETSGHHVYYQYITDALAKMPLEKRINDLIKKYNVQRFAYLEPDEYRLDQQLKAICGQLPISSSCYSTEHFIADRYTLKNKTSKSFVMEPFYRSMRVKHNVLMTAAGKPIGGTWNYDAENRKRLKTIPSTEPPITFKHDTKNVISDIKKAGLKFIGTPNNFHWPLSRKDALQALHHFITYRLPHFGTYQDHMILDDPFVFHALISFSLNVKHLNPIEVIRTAERALKSNPELYTLAAVEGFIRQILGWREYVRCIYWLQMPNYLKLNFFNHHAKLPQWYWTGSTKMKCMSESITQSLNLAYAHHIQRLMITGNFALLTGTHPDEVDNWYLGIYIDAIQWVELPNTRGMSQYADGGIIATKPYVSSGQYINGMSNYCKSCYYSVKQKTGEGACPFNSLYWNFIDRHQGLLKSNMRMQIPLANWNKTNIQTKIEVLEQAATYLKNIDSL